MTFAWLKHYMPRSLYGRAALILLLPVVVVQLVVTILFAERHFSDVTTQMSGPMIRQITLTLETIEAADSATQALQDVAKRLPDLGIATAFVEPGDVPRSVARKWYDFTATVFMPLLEDNLAQLQQVYLGQRGRVRLYFETSHGVVEFNTSRQRWSTPRPHQLFVYMIFFGVVTTSIAYIYLRNQLRPITRLARAAEGFGKGRHVPYVPAGASEVRAAGSAFVDMRARIERHIEQRTLMLSGVSHDLRTPLTRMRLGLSLLEDEDRAALERDVDEMHRLVDEFLNFIQGASEGEAEPVDPATLAQEIVAAAQRAGQPVSLHEVKGSGTVMLRKVAMRRAMDNLISNAVRYAGRADVSVVLTDRSLRIRVEDDGPGIPEAQRLEAQKPFVRLDAARNQDRGAGVGLGLAIATDVARSHGGTLRLGESRRLGGLCADIVIAR